MFVCNGVCTQKCKLYIYMHEYFFFFLSIFFYQRSKKKKSAFASSYFADSNLINTFYILFFLVFFLKTIFNQISHLSSSPSRFPLPSNLLLPLFVFSGILYFFFFSLLCFIFSFPHHLCRE